MADRHSGPGTCDVCMEEKGRRWVFEGSNYCIECIEESIVETIRDQQEVWRPEIEGVTIDPELMTYLHDVLAEDNEGISDEVFRQYQEIDVWRQIPNPFNRICCQHTRLVTVENRRDDEIIGTTQYCNTYLGRRLSWTQDNLHTPEPCPECDQLTCMRCRRALGGDLESQPGDICTQSEDMVIQSTIVQADTPGRGVNYQVCPKCGYRTDLFEGCNEIRCPCGQIYCYLCGTAVEVPSNHWSNPAGCARFTRDGEPTQWDDWYFNPENHDSHHFEPLNAGRGHHWRDIADRAAEVDREHRIDRHGDYGLGQDNNIWMQRIVIAARHLASMLHNGIDRGAISLEDRLLNVYRRIRFEHHGMYFLYGLRILRAQDDDVALPGGNEMYEALKPYARRLRFFPWATPWLSNDRQQEWVRFRALVEDQVHVRYSIKHLALMMGRDERKRAIWTQALLNPVIIMLNVFERSNHRTIFTLAESAILRGAMKELSRSLRALEAQVNGIQAFLQLGEEQRKVVNIAELFASSLLTDARQYTFNWSASSRGEYQFTSTWTEHITESIIAETNHFNGSRLRDMPERLPELYLQLSAFEQFLRDVLSNDELARGISDHNLLDLQRRLTHYMELKDDGTEEGRLQFSPGSGPLRPIFVRLTEVLRRMDQANNGRHISARSSISSSADFSSQEELELANRLHVEVLQQHVAIAEDEDPPTARSQLTLDVVASLVRVAQRIVHPRQHDRARNQADFDMLTRVVNCRILGVALQPEWGSDPLERRLIRAVRRTMDANSGNVEINPDYAQRRTDLRTLREELEAAERELQNFDDTVYVEGLRQCLYIHHELWAASERQSPVSLLEYLEELSRAARYHALPAQLRGEPALVAMDSYQASLARFNTGIFAIGPFVIFDRLLRVLRYVTEWRRD